MKKIGIFDSGMGGITVLHECYRCLKNVSYVFYADTDHVPFGLKTNKQILEYTDKAVGFLFSRGSDAVIIACNTATSVAIDSLRKKYDRPIIGMEPAVKPAVSETEKRILVTATPVTIREEKLQNLITRVDSEHRVDLLALPGLVTFAENEVFDGSEVEKYLYGALKGTDMSEYSAVVLGCTHFRYFKPVFRKIFGNAVELIDGGHGTVMHLSDILGEDGSYKKRKMGIDTPYPETDYYLSGREIEDGELMGHIMRMHGWLGKMIDNFPDTN